MARVSPEHEANAYIMPNVAVIMPTFEPHKVSQLYDWLARGKLYWGNKLNYSFFSELSADRGQAIHDELSKGTSNSFACYKHFLPSKLPYHSVIHKRDEAWFLEMTGIVDPFSLSRPISLMNYPADVSLRFMQAALHLKLWEYLPIYELQCLYESHVSLSLM